MSKMEQFIEILEESQSESNGNVIMTLFALQRCSLLFQFDEFANNEYDDYKLATIRNLFNWATLRTPLYLLKTPQLFQFAIFLNLIFHWMIIILLLTQFKLKRIIINFIIYYQLLIYVPSLELLIEDYGNQASWIITYISIITCYIISCLVNRNYILPQKNLYIKRYSKYNFLLMAADASLLILKFQFNEFIQTINIFVVNFFFTFDSFVIQPFQNTLNISYIGATSFMLFASFIKLLSFWLQQESIFYLILFISPIIIKIMISLYEKLFYQDLFSLPLDLKNILTIADLLFSKYSNMIIMHSIIQKLTNQSNITNTVDVNMTPGIYNSNQSINLIILNLFEQRIEQTKNDNGSIENLYLYKIQYIYFTCKQKSLGYIELKSFQAKAIQLSLYFQSFSCVLHKKLILEAQKSTVDKTKYLSKYEIQKAESLYYDHVDQIISIISAKTKFWLDLSKGYKRIEQMAKNAFSLSQLIWKLKDEIFHHLNFKENQVLSEVLHLNALELKLLAILHSIILNDYHTTFTIEKRLEEIQLLEKNQQTDKITNSVLLNDSLCIIATSFAKQPGCILNNNKGQLANFFGFSNQIDFQTITNIEQLMPLFIQKVHKTIIKRYIKRGHSVLQEQTKETFIKKKDNFIQAVNISLLQMFELDQDFVIHGVLQKIKQKENFILFDKNGKILGITQQIFEILGVDLKIEQLLSNGYIYFWFHNSFFELTQIVNDNQDSHYEKSQIIYPIVNFVKLSSNHDFALTNTINKSQDHDQFQLNSWQKTSKSNSLKEQSVQLMSEYQFQARECELIDKSNPYNIKFSVQHSNIGEDLFQFFIMKINEIEKIKPHCYDQSSENSTLYQNQSQHDQNFIKINVSEKESCYINHPHVSLQIKNIKNLLDSCEYLSSHHNFCAETYNLNTQRENNHIKFLNDCGNSESEKRKNQLLNSELRKKKVDIKQSIQNKAESDLQIDNQRLSLSTVTTDKTQIAGFHILRKLQNTTKYQSSLVKVIYNTAFLIIFLTCLIILQLSIARQDMNDLKSQITLIRIPDKFNRLYCTFAVLGQMDLEMKLLGINYGDYYKYRIQQEGNQVRLQMLSQVLLIKEKFSQYDSQSKLNDAEIAIVNQFLFSPSNVSLIQFSEMANDYTQAINSIFPLNTQDSLVDEQIKLLFLKGNLINLTNMIANLVDQIVSDFFLNINRYQQIPLIFLIIQLILISFAIGLQHKLWIEPHIYQQNILLLICRIPEKETETLIQKYKQFKDSLQNEVSKWKQTNYFKDFFNCKLKIPSNQKLSILLKTKQQIQRIPLNQRIQETEFSVGHLQMMLLFFWMLLTIFVLTSYFFENQNIQNSYPELNLCMQFVRFKQEFDSFMIISQFIKNQPLLSDYQKLSGIYDKNPEYNKSDGFFKTYTQDLIQQFNISLEAGKNLYEGIYENIVVSQKISATNKNLLLGLYQEDLCNYIEADMPFCDYKNGKFKYFPEYPQSDEKYNNRERLRQGFNGIYQQVLSIFQSKYTNELNGIEVTNHDEIKQFLETPEYAQLILPYFFDLDKAIVKFYVTILNASLDILESDFQQFQTYYICYGIVVQVIFLTIVIFKVRKIQTQVRAIRQALVLLPHESLLDVQIFNAIKRIGKEM